MMARLRTTTLIGLANIWLMTAPVAAQSSDMDVQLWQPTAAEGSTFSIARPSIPAHLSTSVGLGSSFALRPLERGNDGAAVAQWVWQSEVLAALALFKWMQLGIAAPLVVASSSDDPLAVALTRSTVVRPGDLRLSVQVPLLRGDFALAARLVSSVPTGDGSRFIGSRYWTTFPSLVAAYMLGRLTLAGELGYRLRRRTTLPGLEFDDELHLALGATYRLLPALDAVAETQVRVGVGGDTLRGNEIPMEADLGLRWRATHAVRFDVGGGTAVLDGYGAPSARALFIARYVSEPRQCPQGPEDFDGFEDGDFCADLDNDADGLHDAEDSCPNDAEDRDGFADEDGCPDLDHDADGVPDARDQCPTESEDRDGFEDLDGCPEPDNDQDGVADGLDKCPMEPEDRDRFQDEDGCPEPGPKQATVTVTDTRILISERIYFDFDTDTIRPVSMPLLDQVAKVIRELPRRKRVRIEGYTDSQGDAEYNRDLSYKRARAVVEYLASKGVRRERLSYAGYGQQRAVAPNDTPEGRALNRRVEFTILEPNDTGRKSPQKGRRRRPTPKR
ncbi:MAG: OmpA family protein [Polyangiales bacterium]